MLSMAGDRLLLVDTLACQDWASLANSYIAMGEEKAMAGLIERSKRTQNGGDRINFNTRTCLMARLLFEPKGSEPLRGPRIGAFMLPNQSMPLKDWPTYPFVIQDGVAFLMSESLAGTGIPESCTQYITYLQKEGRFRTKEYLVPSKEQAEAALTALYSTPRWHKVEWSYKGRAGSYSLTPSVVTDYLTKQITAEY